MMGTTRQTWGSYKSNLENKRTTCAYNETFPTSLSNTTKLRQQILTFWAQEQKKHINYVSSSLFWRGLVEYDTIDTSGYSQNPLRQIYVHFSVMFPQRLPSWLLKLPTVRAWTLAVHDQYLSRWTSAWAAGKKWW